MEMLNLEKWNAQTIESVRHVLQGAEMPCIGFSMVFLEPVDGQHSMFRFKTMLAFDPDNPVSEEDRKKLEDAFEQMSGYVELIMNDKQLQS
jgi:hypothetical protein